MSASTVTVTPLAVHREHARATGSRAAFTTLTAAGSRSVPVRHASCSCRCSPRSCSRS